jgi:glycine oxidase
MTRVIIGGTTIFYSRAMIVVVGGGVIGASCAYHLAKKGAAVTLLERRHFGAGASGCSAAMLECQTHAHRGEPFLSLARPSLALFPALYQEIQNLTGIDFEYDPCGVLNLAMTDEDAVFFQGCVRAQQALKFRASWLTPAEVEKRFPQINPEYTGAAFYEDDGQINGEIFLQALLEGARRLGVTVVDNAGPVVLKQKGSRVCAVAPTKTYEGDAFVVAAGAWSDSVCGELCFSGITPVRGQLIFYSTPPKYLPVPLFTRQHGYVVSKKGYTLVGTTVESVGFDEGPTESAKADLIHKAHFLVPGLSRAPLRGISAGLRPQSPGDLPLIGPVANHPNVFLAAGHFRNGMLLAPITGELITAMVLKNPLPVDPKPFSPLIFQRVSDTFTA